MGGRLEARGVGVTFRGGFADRRAKAALKDITLSVGGGRPAITAIVGESGSGKTTLTRVLLGFQRPTAGQVRYDGEDIARLDRGRQRTFRREVQAVFQDPFEVFNPFYTVDHALLTPLLRYGLARDGDEAYARMEAVLESIGLRPHETLGRYPHQLSGGQRQRIMIARVLLVRPRVILADEPVSMVDASLRSTILDLLHRLKTEGGMSLLYVTHDLTTAYQIAETVVVLYAGAIVEAGSAEAVIRAPKHPYTQALIAAIPPADPTVSWGLDAPEGPVRPAAAPVGGGCAFAPRCPRRMERCAAAEPPLYRVEPARAARCFLYDDRETTDAAAVLEAAA